MEKKIKNNKCKAYFIYTGLFAVIFLLIYWIFLKTGKSFVWEDDGFKQHFAILYNFNYIIRNIFTNGIQMFSWNLGLGLDVISQYSYYILGDPFAYLSLLFPMDKLEIAYDVLIVLRMYFVGIAFLAYCKYNKKDNFNSLLGTIIYVFSGFMIYAGVRHPYFLNAAILLPLVLIGIDKILKEDKITFFIIMIAITTISNYYFLYMITILSVIYAIVKFVCEYKELGIKAFFSKFLKAFLGYLIGVLIGGILLLPTISGYINSNRFDTNEKVIYNMKYYYNLFTGFTSNNSLYWSRICTTTLVLIMLPVSWLNRKKNKENRTIFTNIVLTTIILLVPFLGSVMNGFSFSTNRWTFGYVFLLSYMVVLNFRKNLKYTRTEISYMILILMAYWVGLYIVKGSVEIKISFISTLIALLMIAIIAVINVFRNKIKNEKIIDVIKYIVFALVIVNIIFYGNNLYLKSGKNYISEFIKDNKVISKYNGYNGKIKNVGKVIEDIKKEDNTFYRISTNETDCPNLSLIYNYKATDSYLSVGNKYIGKLSKELSNRLYNTYTNPLKGFDNRTKILTLLGNKYFIVNKKQKNTVPYGYTLYKENGSGKNTTQIYENKNYLGLGAFYDNYVLKDDYNKLDAIQKEQAFLDTAVLEKEPTYNVEQNTNLIDNLKNDTYKNVKYEIGKNDILKNKKIKTTKKNEKIVLNIEEVHDSELYLIIKDFKYKGNAKNSIKIKYKGIERTQSFRNKIQDPYYFYNNNIVVNLGYKEKHKGKIEIEFENKEEYSYKDMKVVAVPMNLYDESIQKLKQTEFKLDSYENDCIIGSIENSKSGILQLSIPYTNGWTAYVDGNKVETQVVNTAFIGITLEKGKHEIKLEYKTPYLKLGIIFTIIGLTVLIILIVYERKKYNENGEKIGSK